jgi:hypothetical protein
MRAQINAGKLGESEKVPMLQRLLQYCYVSSNQLMPDHDIISESTGHMYVSASSIFLLLISAEVYMCCPLVVFTSCIFILQFWDGRATLESPDLIHHQPHYHTSFGSSAADKDMDGP